MARNQNTFGDGPDLSADDAVPFQQDFIVIYLCSYAAEIGEPEMFLILSVMTFNDLQKNIDAANKYLTNDTSSSYYDKRHVRHDPDF